MTPTRPVLRWHGGKWKLAPWIIAHLPPHRVYVEPFGGAASVLLRKSRSYAEVYNDLDDDVVGLFRVLRDEGAAARLVSSLELTPFGRVEFLAAYETTDDPVEAARRLIIRSFMGHGSDAHTWLTGFRANSNKSGTTPAHDWVNLPPALRLAISRLQGVIIEHRPALDVMKQHDAADTLHYLDPPYLHETRSQRARRSPGGIRVYRHEMSDTEHAELLAAIAQLAGMVVLSGYPSPLYDDALPGWRRVEASALADGARPRTEVLWINPAAAARLEAPARTLFCSEAA